MARGAFWTIIVDDQPTAFRAPVREDLIPTLKQLQRQNPAAAIKWFQRGKLWDTPGDAMDAGRPPRRGAEWRPGGEHKDPRAVYQVPRDVKRKRWAAQAADGRGPWVKGADRAPGFKPKGDKPWRPRPDGDASGRAGTAGPTSEADRRPRSSRPPGDEPAWRPKSEGDRASGADRPRGGRPHGDKPAWRPRPDDRESGGDRPRSARPPGAKPAWRPKTDDRAAGGDRPRSSRPAGNKPWRPKTDDRAHGDRPRSSRPPGDKPAWRPKGDGPSARTDGDRFSKPSRPRGDRPGGDRPGGGDREGWRPKADRPQGDRTGWKPAGDRPPRKSTGEGRAPRDFSAPRGGQGSGAPRTDWREDRRGPRDATARSGDARPAAAPKKGRTWKVGELPPADRKRKKGDE
ncbi:MAG TPA: hypothetical protein VMF13_13830 [Luteitalea sp.]|nr:hypothetical protein [Luteitalea sp.]